MKIKMDYGKEGIEIQVPDSSDVLIPNHKNEILEPEKSITESLISPINSSSLFSVCCKLFAQQHASTVSSHLALAIQPPIF